MSKIQDALKRLQSEDANSKDRGPRPEHASPALARISTGRPRARGDDSLGHALTIELNQKALRNAGLIAPGYHEQMLADQYRNIKRPLIANAYGKRVAKVKDGNIIVVTSALPGEGKTFTAINLAMSVAQEQDYSALLVDADVAKPQISNVFGLGDAPGLLDLLDGSETQIQSLVVGTDVQGLCVLPAGKPRHNATELLSSSRMEALTQELASKYPQQISVLDTPPLLQTSESRVISNAAGQVVLVVKAEGTSQVAVEEALQVLGDDSVVNLVLNQSRSTAGIGHHDYGYGTTYG